MTYTVSQYQKAFHPCRTIRSVYRIINSGRMPKGHLVNRHGNYFIVEVVSETEEDKRRSALYDVAEASREYRRKVKNGKDPMEAAAEVVICYNISMTLFCEIHNIK